MFKVSTLDGYRSIGENKGLFTRKEILSVSEVRLNINLY